MNTSLDGDREPGVGACMQRTGGRGGSEDAGRPRAPRADFTRIGAGTIQIIPVQQSAAANGGNVDFFVRPASGSKGMWTWTGEELDKSRMWTEGWREDGEMMGATALSTKVGEFDASHRAVPNPLSERPEPYWA